MSYLARTLFASHAQPINDSDLHSAPHSGTVRKLANLQTRKLERGNWILQGIDESAVTLARNQRYARIDGSVDGHSAADGAERTNESITTKWLSVTEWRQKRVVNFIGRCASPGRARAKNTMVGQKIRASKRAREENASAQGKTSVQFDT